MDTLTRLLLLTTLGCVEIEPVALVSLGPPRGHEVMSYAAGESTPLVFAAVPLHAPVPVVRVLTAAPLRPRRHPPPPSHHAAGDADYEDEPRAPRVPRPNKQRSRPPYQQDSDYDESYQFPRQTVPSPPAAAHRPPRPRPQITQYEEEYETYAPQPSFTAPSSYVQPQQTYSYSTSYAQPQQTYPTSYAQPQGYSTLAQPQYEAVYATGGSEPAPALLYARPSPTGGYTYRKIAPKTTTQIPVKPTKESPYIIKIHKYRITKS